MSLYLDAPRGWVRRKKTVQHCLRHRRHDCAATFGKTPFDSRGTQKGERAAGDRQEDARRGPHDE